MFASPWFPARRMTALVGNAPDLARVVMHLRPARRRIARFDTSPHSLSLLRDAVQAGHVTAVVAIGPDAVAEARLRQVLGALDLDVSLYVSPLDGVRPEAQLFGILPVRPLAQRPIPSWGRVVKAVLDRAAALAALALLLPVMFAVASAIRLDSRGPILLRQWREGRNGAAFPMLRFRTMHGPPGPRHQALAQDSRVTRVGQVLRATRLDELPQLLNVLRGEMSLVGPRPYAIGMRVGGRPCAEIAPDYPLRHRVKPGMTGLAQVAGLRGGIATAEDLCARLALDLAYISAWSVTLDARLLLLTPWTLIVARGAPIREAD